MSSNDTQYIKVLDYLFDNYYLNEKMSSVVSSHWKKFGSKGSASKVNNQYIIRSFGVSNYQKRSISRLFQNLIIGFFLKDFIKKYCFDKESLITAKKIAQILEIYFSFNHIKHVIVYDILNRLKLYKGTICIIGDGDAFMGTLIKKLNSKVRILFVNIGKNLISDVNYYSKIFPNHIPVLISKRSQINGLNTNNVGFLEAEKYQLLYKRPINLFINIASMQEMNPSVINNYFNLMRSSSKKSYFYCLNRQEKVLPDGTAVRFRDYQWENSKVIIDEICPFVKKFPTSIPPFWKPFDGVHLHKLIELN